MTTTADVAPTFAWRNYNVTGLSTLQFGVGGLLDTRPVTGDDYAVHLVRSGNARPPMRWCRLGGTPGPTLCGIDRFAEGSAGWAVGGGCSGPNIVHTPCPGCLRVAVEQYPGLRVSGSVGGREMRAAIAEASR